MAHRDLATSDDGAGDPQSGHPADVADDVVQLVIHVRHRLLQVLHVRRGVFEMPILKPYEPAPMPISRRATSSAAHSGASYLATAQSLNACPYRAEFVLHRRPLR